MLLKGAIYTRVQFGSFLNDLGLTKYALEVGTHQGDFALAFLDRWNGLRLFCLDPWSVPEGYESQVKFLPNRSHSRERDLEICKQRLNAHDNRVTYLRYTSEAGSLTVKDGALDFVYLDGDHRYEAVKKDLELWWPKVRRGGVIAGHDFLCPGPPGEDNWGREIQPAVLEFSNSLGVDVHLVDEPDGLPWSYYIQK